MSLEQVEQIAAALGLSSKTFIDRYADPRWQATKSILVRQQNGACIFLDQTGTKEARCTINDIKPASCRDFKAELSQKECREGLAKCWSLGVNEKGELEGNQTDIGEFLSFAGSLE